MSYPSPRSNSDAFHVPLPAAGAGTTSHYSMQNNTFTMNNNNYQGELAQESQDWVLDTPNEESYDLPWGISSPPRQSPYASGVHVLSGSPSFTEYTPSFSSQEASNSEASDRFPSQGSDFFCPASPTYAWSLPRMSPPSQASARNSQNSWPSFSSQSPSDGAPEDHTTGLLGFIEMENMQLFMEENGMYGLKREHVSGSSSGSSQSQPDMKRTRYGC